jgi:isocitrate/isopropylmalate dehydrogenase
MRVIRSAHALAQDRTGRPRPRRCTDCLDFQKAATAHTGTDPIVIGVLGGAGAGTEATQSSLLVLESLAEATGLRVQIVAAGPVIHDGGDEPEQETHESALSSDVIRFCSDILARGGAILSGAGSERFRGDLRKHFDLFLNIRPVRMVNGLPDASPLRPQMLHATDLLITQETIGGVCEPGSRRGRRAAGERVAEHSFRYSEDQVRRFLLASARLARGRSGKLTVAWKEAGLPAVSALWRDCAAEAAQSVGVRAGMVDAGLLAYRLIHEAQSFDVIAAPNLVGDLIGDISAALLGSRALLYSADFGTAGPAVYQADRQEASQASGKDRANPAGAILALALLLRESFDLCGHAELIEEALRMVWREGWRTEDVAVPTARAVGSQEIGRRVAETAARLARRRFHPARAQ